MAVNDPVGNPVWELKTLSLGTQAGLSVGCSTRCQLVSPSRSARPGWQLSHGERSCLFACPRPTERRRPKIAERHGGLRTAAAIIGTAERRALISRPSASAPPT